LHCNINNNKLKYLKELTKEKAGKGVNKMKFFCSRDKLIKNLQIAQRAVDAKSQAAVLRNVLMDASGGKLNLVGYDHRMGIRTSIDCQIDTEGSITVPCALLIDILGVMQEEQVYFTLEDSSMKVECGRSKYNLSCISADDFPPFPKIEGKDTFEMEAGVLETGIRQTIFATNPDDHRAFMGGVLLNLEKNEIKFVSTDGHRLAMRKFDVPGGSLPTQKVIIPTRTLNELLRILPDAGEEKVKVTVDVKSISFTLDGVFVTSRLVEAEYPKFEKVIPTRAEGQCRINRTRMMGSVRGASIMARSKENRDLIEINVTDDSIKFTSSTQDVGSASEELEVVKKGKDIRVAFNSKYILDFLGAVEEDEVVFDYTEELDPGLFHTDMPGYTYVLMPIKV